MNADELKKFKESLLKEKRDIEGELGKIAKKNPMIKGDWIAVPPDIADPADTLDEKAQAVTGFEERRAVEQSLELRLEEINDTLAQIENGTFGKCTKCSKKINSKRLTALLTVKFCINCAKEISTIA